MKGFLFESHIPKSGPQGRRPIASNGSYDRLGIAPFSITASFRRMSPGI